MTEICANGIDDDGDGLVDLNDPECNCPVIEPVSLIPNPSFEELQCCPTSRSQLGCAEVWIQASEPTTDLISECGWEGWDDYPPPRPFPDGETILGFRDGRPGFRDSEGPEPSWKEYAGACLLEPLQAGSRYRFEFDLGFASSAHSPPINVTFFGTTDCSNLPFGVGQVSLGCPTNGPNWTRLGSTTVNGGSGNQWVEANIEVTPSESITAIAIGPDCLDKPSNLSLYYFFDNLVLADFESFNFRVTGTGNPCAESFLLQLPNRPELSYQWYKEGVALVGETSFRLSRMYGEGAYIGRIDDGAGCRISATYYHQLPVVEQPARVTICEESFYPFGDLQLRNSGNYVDTFKTVDNCDSIVALELIVLGELLDTVAVKIFEGEEFDIAGRHLQRTGEHMLHLASSIGCDSLVLVDIDFYDVYFPTAFSPNGDGINDRFEVLAGEDLLEVRELAIFDRWGNFLSTGLDWDGTRQGQNLSPGVYVYRVSLLMEDGNERTFLGSVVLMR